MVCLFWSISISNNNKIFMKKYITVDRVLMILAIIYLISLNKYNVNDFNLSLQQKDLEYQTLDSIKNKYGETILVQDVLITSQQSDLHNLTDSIFNLKNKHNKRIKEIILYYSNLTSTEIKDRPIPYLDKPSMKRFQDSIERKCAEVIKFYRDSSVQVPLKVKDSSAYFNFEGSVMRDSFIINKIQFVDSQYLRVIKKKNGLFKPKTFEIQMFHTSPYITTNKMTSVIYKPPKKNNGFLYPALVAVGLLIGIKL